MLPWSVFLKLIRGNNRNKLTREVAKTFDISCSHARDLLFRLPPRILELDNTLCNVATYPVDMEALENLKTEHFKHQVRRDRWL